MSFVKRFSEKTLEKENITKEGTRRCPLPSPDQCAINDAADKVFGDEMCDVSLYTALYSFSTATMLAQ